MFANTDKRLVANLDKGAIAVIGCSGYNVLHRVMAELKGLQPETIMGYDIAKPAEPLPFPWTQVADDAELAARLNEQKPRTVLIETPDFAHGEHIRLALACGAKLVLCEKPLGVSPAEAAQVLTLCQKARERRQQTYCIDHYRNILAVKLLLENARRWLGPLISIEVVLLESQPVHPVASYRHGCSNFIHHLPAMASLLYDPGELKVVKASKAKFAGAEVPDTYRGLVLCRPRPRPVMIRGCVGKKITHPKRRITVTGLYGKAVLDRETHELKVVCKDGFEFTLKTAPDSGYRGLARSLAAGRPLPSFLIPEKAFHCVRLVDEGHVAAVELEQYPDGTKLIFGPPSSRAA